MKIVLKDVYKEYKTGNKILYGMNFIFNEGIYLVKGPSGAGKTTLLNIISGYSRTSGGEILLFDVNKICYVMQESLLFSNLTVEENLIIKYHGESDKRLFVKRLQDLGLDKEILSSKLAKLSGGQIKKIELLLCTVQNDFDVLLLDEPLNNLDERSIGQVARYIESIYDENKVMIIVSHHDLGFQVPYKILELENGGWK